MAINEDTAGRAFYGELPEFDHNELVGWFDRNPHAPELRVVVLKGRTGSDLLDFIVDNIMAILTMLLLFFLVLRKKKLTRPGGIIMLLSYVIYFVVFIVLQVKII